MHPRLLGQWLMAAGSLPVISSFIPFSHPEHGIPSFCVSSWKGCHGQGRESLYFGVESIEVHPYFCCMWDILGKISAAVTLLLLTALQLWALPEHFY